MKSTNLTKELRTLSTQDLKQRATKTAEELMKLRFRNSTRQLKETHEIQRLRKEMARIRTILSEQRLAAGKA